MAIRAGVFFLGKLAGIEEVIDSQFIATEGTGSSFVWRQFALDEDSVSHLNPLSVDMGKILALGL